MNAIRRSFILALGAVLAGSSGAVLAQGAAPGPKKELVAKVLKLQQANIEALGNQLAGQTANQMLQAATQSLGRVAADKREALAAELQAEVRKFFDEAAPLLRERAVKLAPSTIGAALEEKFSEDELKSLIAWLESPVSRKYQQLGSEVQQGLMQKVVAESRPQIEPKLKALDQALTAKLAAAGAAPSKAAAPAPKK